MTGEDVAWTILTPAVPALLGLLLVLAAIAVSRTTAASGRRSYLVAAGAFGFLLVCGLASVYWFWGVGFEYADTGRRAPAYVDRLEVGGFWLAAGAYVGVLITGLMAYRALRRHRAIA